MPPRALPVLLAAVLLSAGCIGNAALDPDASDPGTDAPGTDEGVGTVDPGWPSLEEAQIRPGVNVVDGSCTSNFLFRTPDNGTLFLGTAAHCVTETEIGEPVAIRGGAFEGTLAYSSFQVMEDRGDDIPANDFALIELPDEVRSTVHPAMLTYGGPTGIAEDVAEGDKVLAHGNSTLRPDATPDEAGPREGYVTHHDDWATGMYFVGPGVPGDSGSAVTTADGRALGTLVTLEIAPQPASNNVANLDATLAYANDVMDRQVELVTWEASDDGTLPNLDQDDEALEALP